MREGFRLHHFDLWRLEGADSLAELGWDEALADVVIVEWPDRLGALRPAEALFVRFVPVSEDMRQISFEGWEDRALDLDTRRLSSGATGRVTG
jgi:tRNA threonylcarbamoyladenosine biosynthesis protein TsaE